MGKKTYLEKIRIFYQDHKRMPSYQEVMRLVGFRSKNAVYKLMHKLIELNVIEKDSQGRIIPGPHFHSIRLLGTVEAGFPSPAEEELIDTISLDDFLIKNKEATFILNVKGDSMIEAGILPGDMVLVERSSQAKDGDIVIAEVDDNWSMKYLRKKGRHVYLEPANKKYKAIYPKETLKIEAIVKAVIRKY